MGTSTRAIPRSDLLANAVGAAWTPLNPLGLPQACFLIDIINDSNIALDISLDGVDAHDWISADNRLMRNPQPSRTRPNQENEFPKGQIIYVRAPVPGIGNIMLAGYFV